MLSSLLYKEIFHLLHLNRFWIALLTALPLMVCGSVSWSIDYKDKTRHYQESLHGNRQQLSNLQALSQIDFLPPVAIRRPNILGMLSTGVDFGSMVACSPGKVPREAELLESENPFLTSFPGVDFTFVVKFLFSLFALILCADSVCGEAQRGTLALMLSNSVPLWKLLLGKYAATMIVLSCLLVVTGLVALIIGTNLGEISLYRLPYEIIALMAVLSLLYVSFFCLVGMVCSIVADTPSTSMIVGLLIWTIAVIAAPNVIPYLSEARRVDYGDGDLRPFHLAYQERRQEYLARHGKTNIEDGLSGHTSIQVRLGGFSGELILVGGASNIPTDKLDRNQV